MSPKPVYDELIKLIKGKWWTKTTVKVDENRKVKFRGFLGEYKIIVNGSERTFSLTKDKESIVVSF